MILIASSLSLTEPMCQPPRQRIGTRTPVLPSGRVGRPFDAASLAWAAVADRPRAALAARVLWRNSRRLWSWGLSGLGVGLLSAMRRSSPIARGEGRLPIRDCLKKERP